MNEHAVALCSIMFISNIVEMGLSILELKQADCQTNELALSSLDLQVLFSRTSRTSCKEDTMGNFRMSCGYGDSKDLQNVRCIAYGKEPTLTRNFKIYSFLHRKYRDHKKLIK
jgi:hypothetical protein